MKAKAPDIRRSNVDTNSLIIVGIDVEVNDENRDYLDEAVDDRVLSSNAAYNAASDEEKDQEDEQDIHWSGGGGGVGLRDSER